MLVANMRGEAGAIALKSAVVAPASGCVALALAQDFPHVLLQVSAQVLAQLVQPKGIVICFAGSSARTSRRKLVCSSHAFVGDSVD